MNMFTLSAKSCMSHLLLRDTFDKFSFIEGEITTFNKFTLDGFLHKDFFDEKPARDYSYWREVRDLCFSLIKGKRTPLHFKIVLSAGALRGFSGRTSDTYIFPGRHHGAVPEFPLRRRRPAMYHRNFHADIHHG